MRTRYVWRDGEWVDSSTIINKKKNEGPSIINDSIDAFISHADGKMYDSKSSYRKTLRSQGLIEVGNDSNPAPKNINQILREKVKADSKGRREALYEAWKRHSN
ncbi:MAG: hypothetical protein AB7F19_07745 [Candidatus Babeliales bacterium]